MKCRIIFYFTTLCIMLVFAFAYSNELHNFKNLLKDGGFEKWTIETDLIYWEEDGDILRSFDCKGGQCAVVIWARRHVWSGINQTVEATEGLYRLSLWLSSFGSNGRVLLIFKDSQCVEISRQIIDYNDTQVEWIHHKKIIKAPKSTAFITIELLTPPAAAAYYYYTMWDIVRLVSLKPTMNDEINLGKIKSLH